MILGLLLMACSSPRTEAETWRVFAFDYGRSTFRAHRAVRDGDPSARVPFAWMAWLIRGPERTVLVDTGFSDPDLARSWGIRDFKPVDQLLWGLELTPSDVTDVVITHAHWDHMGNVAPYASAKVWIQQEELAWARSRVSSDEPEKSGVRLQDLTVLDQLSVHSLQGDAEIAPGVHVHRGGGHTEAVQWVEVRDGARTVVLATDIAYLYENVDRQVPPGGSRDPEADLEQIRHMRGMARPASLLVPGHDPRVFERFEAVADRVVEIR